MDDCTEVPENVLKTLCCTCLSKDRKLVQLCSMKEGVNNLYLLLFSDPDTDREGIYKDMASLYICWECEAVMKKIISYRSQVWVAQKHLTAIINGQTDINLNANCLSRLSTHCHTSYETITPETYDPLAENADDFTAFGLARAVKVEIHLDEIPMAETQNIHHDNEFGTEDSKFDTEDNKFDTDDNKFDKDDEKLDKDDDKFDTDDEKFDTDDDEFDTGDDEFDTDDDEFDTDDDKFDTDDDKFDTDDEKFDIYDNETPSTSADTQLSESKTEDAVTKPKENLKPKAGRIKKPKKEKLPKRNKYYTSQRITDEEFIEYREKLRLSDSYINATAKCKSCVKVFTDFIELTTHNASCHLKRSGHTQCDLCKKYVPMLSLAKHRAVHCQKHICLFCGCVNYSLADVWAHLKSEHPTKCVHFMKKTQATSEPKKRQRNRAGKRTALGYKCSDCDQYFDKKIQRYKHIRKVHHEGYYCTVCGKRYAFKDTLTKHLRRHLGPLPREECPICHKMIRSDLVKSHAKIHTKRELFPCVICNKSYRSISSYNSHMRTYHAQVKCDILKYKCSMCDKGYRSKGELRDHINYQHLGKTQHQCPICGKALASPRCVTQHVRRAHLNIKRAHPKICQLCGKGFRDSQRLREHEYIHTGERPLGCEICGRTFRQQASLYTHRIRVHKVYPERKHVELTKSDEPLHHDNIAIGSINAICASNAIGSSNAIVSSNAIGSNNTIGSSNAICSSNSIGSNSSIY